MYERIQFTAEPKSLLIVMYTCIPVQTTHYKFSMYSVYFVCILYAINAIARGWQVRLNLSNETLYACGRGEKPTHFCDRVEGISPIERAAAAREPMALPTQEVRATPISNCLCYSINSMR